MIIILSLKAPLAELHVVYMKYNNNAANYFLSIFPLLHFLSVGGYSIEVLNLGEYFNAEVQ